MNFPMRATSFIYWFSLLCICTLPPLITSQDYIKKSTHRRGLIGSKKRCKALCKNYEDEGIEYDNDAFGVAIKDYLTNGEGTIPINCWKTGSVTNMYRLFAYKDSFNTDISCWDVSSVTNMDHMFIHAAQFNGDISAWDVSNVTNMNVMFNMAIVFNNDISNWDVSKVTDMDQMFSGARNFNNDISTWDVTEVQIMKGMFQGTAKFNRDISNWDVSGVTNMSSMFKEADEFNGDISNWNVSSLTTMTQMFYKAAKFNSDMSNWDISAVRYVDNMFYEAYAFDQKLCNWNTDSVSKASLSSMFTKSSCVACLDCTHAPTTSPTDSICKESLINCGFLMSLSNKKRGELCSKKSLWKKVSTHCPEECAATDGRSSTECDHNQLIDCAYLKTIKKKNKRKKICKKRDVGKKRVKKICKKQCK